MKGIKYITMALIFGASQLAGTAFAEIPDGYYNSLEGLCGVALKKAAKNKVRNHTVISYGDDTWLAFKTTDVRTVNGTLVWWDMYSNNQVAVSSGHGGMNIEHSVANSWWGGTKNDAYKDLFHLNPSDATANNRKSNYPLGEVVTSTWENGVTFVGYPASGTCGGAKFVYEPHDDYKGDFARAFFYMFTVYDDIAWMNSDDRNYMYDTTSDLLLRPWAYELLLKWAEEDPVSQKEIDRNEAIYKMQRNRNPFIDNPELAKHIWGSKSNEPFHFDGTYVPGEDPDPDVPGPDDPTVDPTPVPAGYWYAVTSEADLNETDKYVVVAVDQNVVMAATNAGKYMNTCGSLVSIDKSASKPRLATVPADAGVVTLTKTGTGYAMGVSDVSGNFQGYLTSTSAKTLTYSTSNSTNGCVVSITPSASETVLSFGNSAGKLLYNVQAPRFLTYTSNQNPVMLYRLEEEKPGNAAVEAIDGSETPQLIGIFDINGRQINARNVDELAKGMYIVVTNYGVKKIIK